MAKFQLKGEVDFEIMTCSINSTDMLAQFNRNDRTVTAYHNSFKRNGVSVPVIEEGDRPLIPAD